MKRNALLVMYLAAILVVLIAPAEARAQGLDAQFSIIDSIICPLIGYFKSKFAILVAIGLVVMMIIGKMLGWVKDWSEALTIALGLGLLNVVPGLIMSAAGTGGICPGVI